MVRVLRRSLAIAPALLVAALALGTAAPASAESVPASPAPTFQALDLAAPANCQAPALADAGQNATAKRVIWKPGDPILLAENVGRQCVIACREGCPGEPCCILGYNNCACC